MEISDEEYIYEKYNQYLKYVSELKEPDLEYLIEDIEKNCLRPFTLEEFNEIYKKNQLKPPIIIDSIE